MKADKKILDEIVRRVKERFDPLKIILFGSRARGEAHRNSDYDILVIKNSRKPRYERSADLYVIAADLPVEFEFVVYTPSEVKEWSLVPQAFISTAIREGKVLYEKQ